MDFNYYFAKHIVDSLNRLLTEDGVRRDIGALISKRVEASDDSKNHRTITVLITDNKKFEGELGLLGVLNGIMSKGLAITAIFEDRELTEFRLVAREESERSIMA